MLRTDLINALKGKISDSDLQIVINEYDRCSYDYDISKKQTALVVYDDSNIKLLHKFIACMGIAGKSEKTLKQYERSSRKFIEFIGKSVAEITTDDCRFYMNELRLRGLSGCSKDNERRNINTFFEWLVREGEITSNPFDGVERIKFQNSVKVALTVDELDEVRNACKNSRERAVVEFLYSTGCRVGGFVGVRFEDVNFNKKEVILTEKGNKERISYLSDSCIKALEEYIAEYGVNEYLFFSVSGNNRGNQLTVGGIEDMFKKIIKRTSVKATPHTLRDTVATHLLENGVAIDQIQKFLGHASISTTQIYAQTNMSMVKESHRNVIS